MKAFLTSLILILSGNLALASVEAGHSNEIPSVVFWQAINLAILFGVLFYFLKDSVVSFFSQRQRSFLAEAEKSREAQAEAEKGYLDVKHKLDLLNETADESVSRAESEAREMKEKLIQEAQAAAKRIKEDAVETVRAELLKAQQQLRESMARESVESARQILTKDIGSNDHQKLQNEFAQNIQAVNP